MAALTSETRIFLIGGASHVGKSTLGKTLADRLSWDYLATDSLGKHPGRPWISGKNQKIKENVAQHYRTLSVDALLSDVLSHYQKNILPQVQAIVETYTSALPNKSLVIEGSALYPKLVDRLLKEPHVRGIWLTASDRLLEDRILHQSNFCRVDEDAKYLIKKFLARTLLYNRRLKKDIRHSGLEYIHLDSNTTMMELTAKCRDILDGCANYR